MAVRDYSKDYTLIPLNELDRARETARAEMHALAERRGVKMKMRTFYLGSRSLVPRCDSSTRKENALGAKLAFYKAETTRFQSFEGWESRTRFALLGYY